MSENIIEVRNLTYTYSQNNQPTLKNLNLDIIKESWTSILGHNGSGKSTLVRLLTGLKEPDSNSQAQIKINGIAASEEKWFDIRNDLGIVFQNPDNQFVGATVEDDIAFGLENRNIDPDEIEKRIKEVLDFVNMSEFRKMEPSKLSGGQKQRVAIAGILAIRPKVIILDEATSMLDPQGRNQIHQVIQEIKAKYQVTVISVTHDIEEATKADDICVLSDGQLVKQGTPKEVLIDENWLTEMGLMLPFAKQLAVELRQHAIDVPRDILDESELVEYFWKLNSKM
ncbi:energy-coupling factor transporter ATPase [Holzapfeliella floricola]|uniref:ABC transporter, ATP-binding protein n=1 Tax=Holzapfeliella floricola DSM 23037 = JCM 16512 TaxID=1423744 RepID=A0A0R2DJI5_9LACO|nr:energy-coupling factor transporter ATPase [Holzapfeliella floricola]KRN04264.1 ABC transporter, ATP-binding protein [Holzapfeliella floricola DSM 23037 = JCM 16512]